MYEKHFKLQERLFSRLPDGDGSFVRPHYELSIAAMRRALISPDAVISVGGTPGVGKTTFVNAALQTMARNGDSDLLIVRIARFKTTAKDLVAHLAGKLGINPVSDNASQALFDLRRRLRVLHKAGKRIVFVIEDGTRTGTDLLTEIEAITAADTGSAVAAAIIVMGGENLDQYLQHPDLTRLQQRIRQRIDVAPLTHDELRSYIAQAFEVAGGSAVSVLHDDVVETLLAMSGGIPRVANNLLESALIIAADEGVALVGADILQRVQDEISPRKPVAIAQSAPPPVAEISATPLVEPRVEPTEDVPEWDKDPTLAELRPDLDALEQAFNAPQEDDDPQSSAEQTPLPADVPEVETTVPEITLDAAIKRRIQKEQAELERTRREQVASSDQADGQSANDDNTAQADERSAEQSEDEATIEATQEIERLPGNDAADSSTTSSDSPDTAEATSGPSEDQPDATMTQTLKALNVVPPVTDDGFSSDEAEQNGSFFSRLKR